MYPSEVYEVFFFNDTATTEIYTLSLHDALPIYAEILDGAGEGKGIRRDDADVARELDERFRSEEHTSELQSQSNLVCRLLLEKKKKKQQHNQYRQTNKHQNERRLQLTTSTSNQA